MPFLRLYYDLNGIRQVSDLDLKSDRECAGLCQIDRNLCNGFVFGGSDRICYLQTIGSVFGVAGAGNDDVDARHQVAEERVRDRAHQRPGDHLGLPQLLPQRPILVLRLLRPGLLDLLPGSSLGLQRHRAAIYERNGQNIFVEL